MDDFPIHLCEDTKIESRAISNINLLIYSLATSTRKLKGKTGRTRKKDGKRTKGKKEQSHLFVSSPTTSKPFQRVHQSKGQ